MKKFSLSAKLLLFSLLLLLFFTISFPNFFVKCVSAATAMLVQNSSQDNLTKPMQPDPWLKLIFNDTRKVIKIKPEDVNGPPIVLSFTAKFGNNGTRPTDTCFVRCYPPNMSLPVGRVPLTHWGEEISKFPPDISKPKIVKNSNDTTLVEEISWEINPILPKSETENDTNYIKFTLTIDIFEILKVTNASLDLQCWMGLFSKTDPFNPITFDVVTVRIEILPELEIEKIVFPNTILPGNMTTIFLNSKNNCSRKLDDVVIKDTLWSEQGRIDQLIEIVSIDTPAIDNTLPDLEWNKLSYERNMSNWKQIKITIRAKPYEELKSLFNGVPIVITDRALIIYGTDTLDTAQASFQIVARDLDPNMEPKLFGEYASPGFPVLLHVWINNIGSTPTYEPFQVRMWMNDQKNSPFYDKKIEKSINAGNSLYLAIESPPLPENEGVYRFYIEVDYLNQVSEIDEDNNIDSILVRAKLQSLTTVVNNSTWSDRVSIRNRAPAFPEPIFSYIQIIDQNYHYIRGLADVNNWSSPDWVAPIGAEIRKIWNPIQEYHEEDMKIPLANNVSQFNVIWLGENNANGFSVALIVDGNIAAADTNNTNAAIRTLIQQMRSQDRMAIIKFSDGVEIAEDFTADHAALIDAIKGTMPAANNHCLYDAIDTGIEKTSLRHGRKAVLVFTSSPNAGSRYSLRDVITKADTLGVPIFAFGFGDAPQADLKRMAEQTGGIFIYEKEIWDMWYIFKLFAEMFKNHYVLAHTTTDTTRDGTWRLVDVTVNYPSLGFTDSDIGKYKAPDIGVDLFVVKTADTDSFSVGGSDTIQYVRPNEIFTYRITYGNRGSIPCYNAMIKDVLPSLVDIVPGSFSRNPASISSDQHQIFWQIDLLQPGQQDSVEIKFDVKVKNTLPPWQIALIDSTFIVHEQDQKLPNNVSIHIVYTIPQKIDPPVLKVTPEKIRPRDPITVELQAFELIVEWDLIVFFEDGTMVKGYADPYIADHTPLLPMESADQWYRIYPDFIETWKRTEAQQEKITFKFVGKNNYRKEFVVEKDVIVEAEFDCKIHPIILKPGVTGGANQVWIDLMLPKDNNVSTTICNVAGEIVRSFPEIRNVRGGEKHERILSWDGRDDNGNLVASDVYIVVIKAGSNQVSKKIVVIR